VYRQTRCVFSFLDTHQNYLPVLNRVIHLPGGALKPRETNMNTLLNNEIFFRAGAFLLVLTAMMTWEIVAKRRPQMVPRSQRWPGNLLLVIIDTAIVRLVFPLAAVGAAVYAQDQGWGVFNVITLPGWMVLILSILALDLAIYYQHRIFHAVPWLWRIHRVHHADQEFDVTTALRFHPLEILLSMAIKIAVVMMLGAPPIAVIIFEILLNATAMFNHGNVQLSAKTDRFLRLFLVTPDMHRVHHSVIRQETDSNFGFNLPWWDRLFGTYRSQPVHGHLGMTIGLEDYRTEQDQQLGRMLVQPFQRTATRPSTPE
jgi:sterol desaturase/sphingolipid hydroxylase (fatty acid hydroxylase superfamily)